MSNGMSNVGGLGRVNAPSTVVAAPSNAGAEAIAKAEGLFAGATKQASASSVVTQTTAEIARYT